jgi:hypothetical protein
MMRVRDKYQFHGLQVASFKLPVSFFEAVETQRRGVAQSVVVPCFKLPVTGLLVP